MKKYIYPCFCFFVFFNCVQTLEAQEYPAEKNPWIVGFGFNIIYDSGEGLGGIFNIQDNYNYDSPLRFSVEKRYKNDYGLELSFNFNRLLKDKVINGIRIEDDINVFAVDAMYKYYFTNLFLDTYRSNFEGFGTIGASNNFYDGKGGVTANIGLGLNYFITDEFWLSGQGVTKFAIINRDLGSNYLQWNIGFIIRI